MIAVIAAISIAIGGALGTIAAGNGMATATVSGGSSTTTSSSTSPYVLSLVITTQNAFNSTVGDQPAYYVLGPNGLQSSANITLPANREIEVVITNYDNGTATPSAPMFDNVTGTVGGTMEVVSNNGMNSTEGQAGIDVAGIQTVSSLPPSVISHTFTVLGLNLNIPVPASSTVVAYFDTGAAGNYSWTCTTPCGSGASGYAGAMQSPGWMNGSIAVR